MPSDESTLHPVGWFNLEIIENGIHKAGTGTFAIRLIIAPIEAQYQRFFKDLWLTENAIQKTAEQLRAIGYTGNDFNEFRKSDLMAGTKARCQVYHDDYQTEEGETRKVARIGWINDPENKGGWTPTDERPSNLEALNAILKTTSKPNPSGSGGSAPNGDVPF